MRSNGNITPAILAAFLTVSSLWVIIEGAQNEPYITLRNYDAFTQIGIACSLITGWILFATWLVIQILKKRFTVFWSLAIIWAVVVLFYLKTSPLGFLSDLAQFHGAK